VKVNADFPNLVYLLLFQRDWIEWSLTEEGAPSDGSQFLQKIVQVGFDVPAVDRDRLNKVLFAGLDEEFSSADLLKHFDQERWNTIFTDGLQEYFATLRDVHRYLGTFAFHLALFRAEGVCEVNPVDLIAIEALRVFEPDLYKALPAAKLILTEKFRDVFPPTKEQTQSGVSTLLEKAINRKIAEALLAQLFPHIQWATSKHIFGGGTDEEGWFRELRVCSKNVFDRYFQFSIGERELSNARIQRLLSLTNDRDGLVIEFQKLEAEGLLETAIERLEAFKQEVSLQHAESFITAIMDTGEHLSQERPGMFGISPAMHAVRIIFWYLIREPNPARREKILTNAIKDSTGLNIGVQVVALEQPTEKRRRGNDQFLMADDAAFDRLKQVSVARIRRAADDGRLQKSSSMLYVLYRWGDWAGFDEPKTWIKNTLSSPDGIVAVLRACIRPMFTNGKRSTYFALKDAEYFVSRHEFAAAINSLPPQTIASPDERLF
jgi:predicted KAP-like P-loop ATPase